MIARYYSIRCVPLVLPSQLYYYVIKKKKKKTSYCLILTGFFLFFFFSVNEHTANDRRT